MFLDIFPMHEPHARPARPAREPAAETAKSRSAWPFIVAGKSATEPRPAWGSMAAVRPAPASALAAPDTSSFVT
ncbi:MULTISPECIES: hypothetical protein [unclassified Polaromonas]|uniref:hypothetical protein n=1 Tax=unclassified Polaromonas TaxID=2638319 RepID=UPI00129D7CD1|nr:MULTISPECIES: hypothetical protein [unclassified Polaromonas]QGJ20534.1 hypothetical protein F7R28_20485 [Polaromonas sp. Pch-P]